MIKVYISLVVLLFFLPFVYSANFTYDFNETYQGTTLIALNSTDCADDPPLDTGPIPSCGSISDISNKSELNKSDNSRIKIGNPSASSPFGLDDWFLIIFNSPISVSQLTFINWSFEGNGWNFGHPVYAYVYNNSGSDWDNCSSVQINSSSDVNKSCSVQSPISNFFNSSGSAHFLLQIENLASNAVTFNIDYTSLYIEYLRLPNASILNITNSSNFSTSTPLLSWLNATDTGDSAGTLKYHIQVDNNSDFSLVKYENFSAIEGVTATNVTLSTLNNTVYYWRVRSTTSQGLNSSWSQVYNFRIDTSPPNLTIVTPTDYQSFNIENVSINYTISDNGVGFQACWWTNNSGITNRSINCGTNITVVEGADGTYAVSIYANDSVNNIQNVTIHYIISQSAPAISLLNPANELWLNSKLNIRFNYTATDSNNISFCYLYGNWTGTWGINQSVSSLGSGITQNFNLLNLSDGRFKWNVICNDSTNIFSRYTINWTLNIDTTNPNVSIGTITTTDGSQTISFNHTEADLYINTCKYSIYNSSGGVDGINNNITVSCNQNAQSAVVSGYASYELYICGKDYSSNEICDSSSFSTRSGSSVLSITGGGGMELEENYPVIGLNPINGSKSYDDFERIVLYACINNYCSEKISKDSLAVTDFSDTCTLSLSDIQVVSNRMNDFGFPINGTDLISFYKRYKERDFFQGYTSQSNIDKYGLYTSILGIVTFLKITPPSVDKYVLLYERTNKNLTIPLTLTSNKQLKSCEVISDTPGISCKVSNMSIKVYYDMENAQFFTETFSGNILLTTEAESDQIEQKRVNITLRVINLGYSIVGIIGAFLLIALTLYIIIYSRRKNNKIVKPIKEVLDLG